MRTTLTLEPDVAQKLKRRMAEKKISLKAAVNEALRAGLKKGAATKPARFKVEPHAGGGFQPGIDPDRLNQLLDEMYVEEFARKMARDHS
jgi:hypothetical protein